MPKKGIIIAFILLILAIIFIDHEIKKTLLKSDQAEHQKNSNAFDQSNAVNKPVNPEETSYGGIVVKLKPEDPSKYGMVVNDPGTTPRTEEGWENQLRENFEKQKTFESENAKKALEVAKTSESDYQKQMKDLDGHIELFQQKLKENPLDEEAENQLQILYQLKAVGKILKEKVVSQINSPVQNAVPESMQPAIATPNQTENSP